MYFTILIITYMTTRKEIDRNANTSKSNFWYSGISAAIDRMCLAPLCFTIYSVQKTTLSDGCIARSWKRLDSSTARCLNLKCKICIKIRNNRRVSGFMWTDHCILFVSCMSENNNFAELDFGIGSTVRHWANWLNDFETKTTAAQSLYDHIMSNNLVVLDFKTSMNVGRWV